MRTMLRVSLAALVVGLFAGLGTFSAAQDDKPKFSVSEVMQMAHEGGLLKKVVDGKPTKADKADLLEMYVALSKNKPPQGDAKSWKDKTTVIVDAAKGVAKDEKGAQAKLKKAVDCMACHKVHKP